MESGSSLEVDGENAALTLESGTINVSKDYGIYAKNGGSVVINGGTVTSLYAPLTGNNTTGNMNFTVNGGTLTHSRARQSICQDKQILLLPEVP